MNREWMVSQHPSYLSTGILFSLFLGFLVGGAIALAIDAPWVAAICGGLMSIWAGLIYFGCRNG